jgi:hypothetical protein
LKKDTYNVIILPKKSKPALIYRQISAILFLTKSQGGWHEHTCISPLAV